MRRLLRKQQGEVSLTLSLLGIIVAVVGLGIGTISVQEPSTTATNAESPLPGPYPYHTRLEIRDESNNVINWVDGMTWENEIVNGANPGASTGPVKDPKCQSNCDAVVEWNTGNVPASLRGKKANVRVRVPQGYRIVNQFCVSTPGSICDGISRVTDDGNFYEWNNISIQRRGVVTYGINVTRTTPEPTIAPTTAPQPTAVPTAVPEPTAIPAPTCEVQSPLCAPRNLRIDQVSKHNVTVVWDYPANCPGYKTGNDRFWVDIVRPGSPDKIVCATDSGDNEATCTLGKAAPRGRQLDTGSKEFRNKKWDEGRRYSINIFTYDTSGACVSPPGGVSFKYNEPEPDPEPSKVPNPGPGGLQCSRQCIYSEGTATNFRCYEGACPSDRPDCGGNTPKERIDNGNRGCAYAGSQCGLPAYEVSCTTGERLGTGGGSDPEPPITEAPTPEPGEGSEETRKVTFNVNLQGALKDIYEDYTFRVTTKGVCDDDVGACPDENVLKKFANGTEGDFSFNFNVPFHNTTVVIDTYATDISVPGERNRGVPLKVIKTVDGCQNGIGSGPLNRFSCVLPAQGSTQDLNISVTVDLGKDEERSSRVTIRNTAQADQHCNGDFVDPINAATVKNNPLPQFTAVTKKDGKLISRGRSNRLNDFQEINLSVPVLGDGEEYVTTIELAEGTKWEVCRGENSRTVSAADFVDQEDQDDQVDLKFSLILHADEEAGLGSVIFDDLTTTVTQSTVTVCNTQGTCDTTTGTITDGRAFSWSDFPGLTPKVGEEYTYACTIDLADGSTLTCPVTPFTYEDPVYMTLSSSPTGHDVTVQPESTRADLNNDGVVNGNDLTLLMDPSVYLTSTEGDINGDGLTNAIDYTLLLKWFGNAILVQ